MICRKKSIAPNKSRLEYIDVFKGIGILIMIMGHVWFGSRFDHFIHGFHMPMFFFISGFLFCDKPEAELRTSAFIKRKARTLLLPYCVWGSIFYIIWKWGWGNKGWEPFWHLLYENTSGLPIAGALWFLTALFGTEIIYFLLNRYIKNKKVRTALIVFIALSGTVATEVSENRLPFALDAAFVGVGLFHIGYLIKMYLPEDWGIKVKQKKNVIICLLAGCLVTILIFKNGMINMRQGQYANILLFWMNATGAFWIGLHFVIILLSWGNKFSCSLTRLFSRIGRNSIVYLCLNEWIISEVWKAYSWMAERLLAISLEGVTVSFFIFLLTMIFLFLFDIVICQTKLKVLIGR